MTFAVVILAGGEGRRIGGGKPQRSFAGERLIDRALRRAKGWSDRVTVAVRDPAQVEPIEARLIHDDPQLPGPLGGLASALVYAEQEGRDLLLTIPIDMPFLPDDLPARLLGSIGDHRAAIASSSGQLHPVCALWRTAVRADIAAYAAEGRRSLRGLAATVGFVAADWPAEPDDPFFNVNFAEDLCAAERRLRGA